MHQSMLAWDAYTRDVIAAGVHLGGEGLDSSSTATTVKIEPSGDHIVSDGPFAEHASSSAATTCSTART